MSLRKILADDLKWRAVGRMEAGHSQVEVAKWLNVNKSVVRKIWKPFIETGTIKRNEGSGRKRNTATSEDRYLVVTAKRHREMTAIQLSNELSSATGMRISRQTVYRRLHEGALYSRRPMVCIPLTSAHRRARLNWCLEHQAWTHDQWANVLFSDESRFSLSTDSRRGFIWREPGTCYHPSNIREIDSFRGGSLLVWAGISSSRRTPHHIFSGGTLTAQRVIMQFFPLITPCQISQEASWTKYLVVERMPGHRKRRQFKQTDAFTRGMVIGLKRASWSIRQIAADTHLGASTVHRLWRRWLEQGNVAIYRNAGATRVTSARVDLRILRQAVAAPQATCTAILQHVQDTLDHSISTRTISRRLDANGLHSCRPLRRLPLTPPNRHQRLEWCRARSTWMTEWHRVVFSDESRFCLSSDSRRVRVWRRRGERSNPAAIVERPTVRQRGIMVWGAIAYDCRSPLLRIQGAMTAQRYVDDVLRPVTLPYLQGVPNALYRTLLALANKLCKMYRCFPGHRTLLISHQSSTSGTSLDAVCMPRSEDELWQMVEREWRAIPQDAIRTLIDSLPRRVAACIAVR
ncbi:Transposase, partial [Cordylochernes scorpioides]